LNCAESDESALKLKEMSVAPINNVIVDDERATVPADYARFVVDQETDLCTIIFFRKRFNPKLTQQGIQLDTIDNEDFLEVKLPIKSARPLATSMLEVLKAVQVAPPDQPKIWFGPVFYKK